MPETMATTRAMARAIRPLENVTTGESWSAAATVSALSNTSDSSMPARRYRTKSANTAPSQNGMRQPHSPTADSESTSVIPRSEEHTSELQSRFDLVCRLLLEKKKKQQTTPTKQHAQH